MLLEDVQIVRAESQRWRTAVEDHLRGLGAAIQEQFEAWNLSKAEQEVSLLLLKGFSHKEIARLHHHHTPAGGIDLPEGQPQRPRRPVRVLPGGPAPASSEAGAG